MQKYKLIKKRSLSDLLEEYKTVNIGTVNNGPIIAGYVAGTNSSPETTSKKKDVETTDDCESDDDSTKTPTPAPVPV